MDTQSITVQNVNLAADDVSRLRQAWDAAINSATQGSDGSSKEPPSADGPKRREQCPSSDTIAIQDGISNDSDVRLVFAGKDLQEGRSLQGYGLRGESTVHVLGRLKGGAQLGKVVKGRSQVQVATAHAKVLNSHKLYKYCSLKARASIQHGLLLT